MSGQAACDAVGSERNGVPNLFPLLTPEYLALLALKPFSSTHPARPTPRWYALFNVERVKEPFWAGTLMAPLIPLLPTRLSGPASMNAAFDTRIAYLYIDRTLGPAANGHNILVLRGRLPTIPATFGGDPVMRSDTQMRYWDICQNTSIPVGRVGDCLLRRADSDRLRRQLHDHRQSPGGPAVQRHREMRLRVAGLGHARRRPLPSDRRDAVPAQHVPESIVHSGHTERRRARHRDGGDGPTSRRKYESSAEFAASGCPRTAHLRGASTRPRD